MSLDQWFPTGLPRHTKVPWTSASGAINCYFSLILIPIKLARGASKYLKYLIRVPQTKKRLGNTGLYSWKDTHKMFTELTPG